MNTLRTTVEEYLRIRRALGFKLQRDEKLLLGFVEFCDSEGSTTITTELALRWATLPAGTSPGWCYRRLSIVRCFARYMSAIDPATEVPPTNLLSKGYQRAVPYLYSDEEIASLLRAARTMTNPLTAATCETLIGLLAVTGMRLGEAISLNRDDIDWERGTVVIRHSKFNKSREIPIHSSTLDALGAYGRIRDGYFPHPRTPSYFLSNAGTRPIGTNIDSKFRQLTRRAGIAPRSAKCRPRVHDLRHSFACRALEQWYRAGVDVAPRLWILSTYLGHADPMSTYWYLSAKPELLGLAADRLEASFEVL